MQKQTEIIQYLYTVVREPNNRINGDSQSPHPQHESLSVQNAIELTVKAKLIRSWRSTGSFVGVG